MAQKFQSQPAFTWWFTGLPGAGKTSLASEWSNHLQQRDCSAVVLDGDELRRGLSQDLGFSPTDRTENMRRTAEVARLLNDAGIHAVVALVSPSLDGRASARTIVGAWRFLEIHVSTPLEICRQRDPKGLYHRAANNEQFQLTGVQAPYEPPVSAELTLDTSQIDLPEAMLRLSSVLQQRSVQ